jgi:uncharacterized membrane protein
MAAERMLTATGLGALEGERSYARGIGGTGVVVGGSTLTKVARTRLPGATALPEDPT